MIQFPFKYLIIDGYYNLHGTNDDSIAEEFKEDYQIFNLETLTQVTDEENPIVIQEWPSS